VSETNGAAPDATTARPPRKVTLIDSTLRDGMHAVAHQFTPADAAKVATALDSANVPYIEVSHGDGLGGSSFNYGFAAAEDGDYLDAVAPVLKNSKLTVLLIPGIGTKADLQRARDRGAQMVRIATHCTEADIAEQHIGLAKSLGMEVVGFLMTAHMIGAEKLLEQAMLMESYGADIVYFADSAGAMVPGEIAARVQLLSKELKRPVGVHTHHNLGMAIANALAATDSGADYVDGCLLGAGAGAGNAQLEVLAAVMERNGYTTGVDLFGTIDAAQQELAPLLRRPQIIDGASLILGYAGVYSSFLLHAERAAERYDVDARDLLIELGKRKVVGGQEDMIEAVALEMIAAREADTAGVN
jgi:4-hydroxy 2-oxovalerate aldolase